MLQFWSFFFLKIELPLAKLTASSWKLERASDISKILFLKKNFRMAKNFGASEKIYFEIFKINDFGIVFEVSDVFAAVLLPEK